MVRLVRDAARLAAPWRSQHSPGLAEIEALAAEAFQRLPEPVRARLGDVPILVADFADDDALTALGIEDPYDLLGLYHGEDLTQRSGAGTATDLTRIFLYRRPILDEWAEGHDPLGRIVAHVLIHEIGHHLGLSDDDMEAIEAQADAEDDA